MSTQDPKLDISLACLEESKEAWSVVSRGLDCEGPGRHLFRFCSECDGKAS